MIHRLRTGAFAALAFTAFCAAAPPPGLRGNGTMVVQTSFSGTPITVGGNVAIAHKGSLYRIDVLSLGLPGAGSDMAALAAAFLPKGGISGVYDSASGATTVWSDTNRTYYIVAPARAASPAAASAPATTTTGAPDPLAFLAQASSMLQNVQSASAQLIGHATVNGHQATQLDFSLKRQLPGKPAENYHAQTALADDLGGFPVQLTVQSTPATSSQIGGTMKLDLTSVRAEMPDDAAFVTPQGYTRVDSLGGILKTR